jgi:integrase
VLALAHGSVPLDVVGAAGRVRLGLVVLRRRRVGGYRKREQASRGDRCAAYRHIDTITVVRPARVVVSRSYKPDRVVGVVVALKAIYRWAMPRVDGLERNPTLNLETPARRGGRDRIVAPSVAAALLTALSDEDRPIWAAAMYAGLRRGELQALRWEDVELLDGVIHVRRGWDEVEGAIAPKTAASARRVPIPQVLAGHLEAAFKRLAGEFVFGPGGRPFDPRQLGDRAKAAWTGHHLEGLTLHECRHTYASFMIAAGANAKALSTYMGHSTIAITLDRYGHLMPGNEAEAAGLLDAYLARAL